MEAQSTATATGSRLSPDRLSLAASACVGAGVGLSFLLALFGNLSHAHGPVATGILEAGLLTIIALAYLVAPSLGVLACVQLFRRRRTFKNLGDTGMLRKARRRFGLTAFIFGLLSLLVLLLGPGAAQVTDNRILAKLIDSWLIVPGLLATVPSKSDLDPSSYLAMAGMVCDGVLRDIEARMAHRFPGVSVPAYDNLDPNVCVMFAYLEAEAKFKHPFENDSDGMAFTDSSGRETKVASFGVWDDAERCEKVRDQVRVLYQAVPGLDPNRTSADPNATDRIQLRLQSRQPTAFVIDLCRYTEPYQIILAKLDPRPTLALTLDDVDNKIACFSKNKDLESPGELDEGDRLYVPEMFWEVVHRFGRLEGKKLANPAFAHSSIELAEQMIHFRLDRHGAVLRSWATLLVLLGVSRPRVFAFDKPFLICMKKRDGTRPFFVMWVDNAELLTRK